MRLDQDSVAMEYFLENVREVTNHAEKSRRPVFITENGMLSHVILGIREFEAIEKALEVLKKRTT